MNLLLSITNQQASANSGQKMMEAEILKEAVEFGRVNKWIAHASLLPAGDK